MSNDMHTPGPWTFGHWGNDFWVGTEPSGLTGKIARVTWGMGEDVEEGRENARLIASAPTLKAENDTLREVNAELLRVLDYIDKECEVAILDQPFPDWWRKRHPEAKHGDLPMGLRTVAHIKLSMIQDEARAAIQKAEGC